MQGNKRRFALMPFVWLCCFRNTKPVHRPWATHHWTNSVLLPPPPPFAISLFHFHRLISLNFNSILSHSSFFYSFFLFLFLIVFPPLSLLWQSSHLLFSLCYFFVLQCFPFSVFFLLPFFTCQTLCLV